MRLLWVLFFLFFTSQFVNAQQPTRNQLENRRAALLSEIAATQEQLANTKQDRKATVGQLRALNSKLRARQSLINTINDELGGINTTIMSTGSEIQLLNKDLAKLKMHYAESVRYAYKHRTSQNLILFLFSANNFNDAIRRMQYLKKYRDYRKSQADDIRKTQIILNRKIGVLNSNKRDKDNLLQSEETQKSKIQQESMETNQMVQELKGREGELMAQIKTKQRTASRIQEAIRKEIQEEIEIARKKAAEEARQKAAAELARKRAAEEQARKAQNTASGGSTFRAGNQTIALNTGSGNNTNSKEKAPEPQRPSGSVSKSENTFSSNTVNVAANNNSSSYKLALTPEAQALSNSFAANKGNLPWPVTNGYISGRYGRHPHPVYQNVIIDNHGIDIATKPNAPVRAVFSGTVIKVTNINGFVVMISHGEYFTVYTNLATVSVSPGMKVSTKQVIGTAGQNIDGENMINFQIWKVGGNNSMNTVDPSAWIAQ